MAENINIDFMPNRKTADIQRVGAVEDYLKLFTDRAKFCFSSIYDEFSDVDKRLQYLESFSLATPSSVDLTVENAVILQEHESQQVINNFTKTHYVKGNNVGYGGAQNSIICNGYELSVRDGDITTIPRYKHVEFPKGYNFQTSSWKKASVSDIVIEAVLTEIDEYMKKSVSVRYVYTDDETGKRLSWGITNNWTISAEEDFCFSPCWTEIHAPTSTFPYGYINIVTYPYKIKSSGELVEQYIAFGANIDIPFASEAEYNAAVGLTNTPIELIKLQDFQYLVPESQIIVDKALSEDSDNVIANSTVAKALELKADKETVETLSLVVDSKADIIELDALSQKVDGKADAIELEALSEIVDGKADSTTVSALSEAVDGKAEKSEVQSIAQAVEGKAESSDLTAHTGSTDNPHGVTKEQIGLSKAENKSSAEILSELEVGGRNLYFHTKEYDGALYLGWVSLKPTTVRAIEPYTYIDGFGVQRIATAWLDISQEVTVEPNTDYTLSAWIRWENEAGKMLFYAGEGTDGSPYISRDVTAQVGTDTFKRVSYTYNSGTSVISTCRFECDTNTPYLIYGLKLEKGNKATDWTPAPEDSAIYVVVGGRNLLLNTSNPITFTSDEVVSNTYISNMTPTPYFFSKNTVGQWVTISFDYEVTDAEGRFQVNWNGEPWNFCGGSRYTTITTPNQKGKYVRVRQITEDDAEIPTSRKLSVALNRFKGTITISNMKLEFGNVPTDWTPAPEETETRVTSLEERVATLEAALLSLGGEI